MEKNKLSGKKAFRIVISILIAIAVWLYVDVELATDATMSVKGIPVEFSGEDTALADHGLMIVSGYDTTIDLKLSGPRKTLYHLDKEKIRIVVDTSSVTGTGVQSLNYQVVYPDNVLRSNITVQSASAYTVTVTVGELSTKEIPVECNVIGEVAAGYTAGKIKLDPESLVLRGQRDDLLSVSYAKIDLDISGATETVVKELTYTLYDHNDMVVKNDKIRTGTELIQATVPVTTVKKIPLRLEFEEAVGSTLDQVECTIVPANIKLSGNKDVLENLKEIVLDTIYLQDLDSAQTLTYDIPIPEGTTLVSDKDKAVVTIVVSGVSEKTVTTSHFSCDNVPEGMQADVVTENLDVLLRGLDNQMNKVSGDDIEVRADLSEITEQGNFTVPAKVTVNGYKDIGVKGSYQLIVKVTATEQETPENDSGE